MPVRMLALLGLAASVEVLAASLLHDPLSPAMPVYRAAHLAEMMLLIGLFAQEFDLRARVAQLVLAGLVLSLAGDLVNSDLFDLTFILAPATLLSIPPFAAAHLCYVAAFLILVRGVAGRPVPWWLLALAWPVLASGLWWLMIDRSAPPLLLKLSVGYAFVVMLMGLMALALGLRFGGRAWLPAAGGAMFLVSDAILGHYLLDGLQRPLAASQAIWVTYFMAQVLISRAPLLKGSVGTADSGH